MRYTVDQLLPNPSLISTLTIQECELFIEQHAGKRTPCGIKEVRDLVRARISELNKAERDRLRVEKVSLKAKAKAEKALMKAKSEFDKFHEFFIAQHKRIKHLWPSFEILISEKQYRNTHEFWHHARNVGNDLHDLAFLPLGLESVKSFHVDSKLKTQEHFWPRSIVSGPKIIEAVILDKGNFTIELLIELLFKFNQVVTTSRDENQRLVQYYHEYPDAVPCDAYRSCGIILVRKKPFTVPLKWKLLLEWYNIPQPDPYSFDEISLDHARAQGLI